MKITKTLLILLTIFCLQIACSNKQDPWELAMSLNNYKSLPSRFRMPEWIRKLRSHFRDPNDCERWRLEAIESRCITPEERSDLEHIGAYPVCNGNKLTGWSFCRDGL